ncbi:hypothetical protein C1H46_028511 [Malus baccata]|uniref:SMP domain-containing protein n=1 Tax=Malus baccata TaxID=106549 RepID=A0A540LHL6_MALBA|nr:hypothetical protein C1H46_028511 [Malus baccata]
MNQEQPQRHRPDQSTVEEPIKYGNVFNVSGELAYRPVAPRHAATAQAAENLVLGENMRGGPAAVSRQLDTTRALALLVTATPLKSPERKASPLLMMKQLIPMATALSLKKLLDRLWHNMWSHRCQWHLQEKRLIEMQLQLVKRWRPVLCQQETNRLNKVTPLQYTGG